MGRDVPDPSNLLQIQHQIRENATELQDYLKELYNWEKDISTRVSAKSNKSKKQCPNVRTAVEKTFSMSSTPDIRPAMECNTDPTPTKSREVIERESGNANYKSGNYVAAIDNYTKCLACNPRNPVVLSNRAMAYLKNAQYNNAEIDCTTAIEMDAGHLKSYSRRGTARNALGKHRLALIDFEVAGRLDPSSKEVQSQLIKTRKALKAAIKRAPKTSLIPTLVAKKDKMLLDGSEQESIKVSRLEIRKPNTHDDDLSITSMRNEQATIEIIDDSADAVFQLIPNSPPKTSYVFYRVWRSLTPRFAKQTEVFEHAKIRYLLMLHPAQLKSIFEGSIESDVLCEIFRLFKYHWNEFRPESFIEEFVRELPKISRFRLSIMFLDKDDQENISWVLERVSAHQSSLEDVFRLKQLYNSP